MDKFVYISCTLILMVYGQLIIKARSLVYAETFTADGKLGYLTAMFTDVGVLSGLAAAAVAGALWVLAIEKTDLTFAYPFMALSFVLVPAIASLLFHEPLTAAQLFGLGLIVAGVTINAFAQ
jgi:drug/metabolite transporter (DMT)-like permease